MKTLIRILLATTLASATALSVCAEKEGGPPGLQKKGGVPPGLQKKGGLPPGQAKKHGKSGDEEEEKAAAVTNAPAAVSTSAKIPDAPKPPPSVPDAPAPPQVAKPAPPEIPKAPTPPEVAKPGTPDAPKPPAQPQIAKPSTGQLPKPTGGIGKTPEPTAKPAPKLSKEAMEKRERLQKEIADLDTMAQKPEVRERLMVRLYRNFDIPLSTLEAQLKANPNVGMGGLYIAHGIARKSHHPADTILAEHKAGKDWTSIADAHKVSISDVTDSMKAARETARVAEKESAKR